jgi:hypothetical protein
LVALLVAFFLLSEQPVYRDSLLTLGTDRFQRLGIGVEQVTYFAMDVPFPPRTFSVIYRNNLSLTPPAREFISLSQQVFVS